MPDRFRSLLAFGLCAGACLAGCAVDNAAYTNALGLRAPVELEGALLVLDTGRQRLMRLHDSAGGVATETQPLDVVPQFQAITADRKKLLWLDTKLDKGKQKLAVLSGSGQTDVVTLPSGFSSLALSSDDQTALAWHAPGATSQGIVIATELSLVQLSTSPPTVQTTAVAGLSSVPLGAHVSPPVTAADGIHRVAWVEAVSALGIADFGPKGPRTLVIPLTASGSTVSIVPARTEVRIVGTVVHLYLVAAGSDDAVHVTIDVGADQLGASLDQLASGPQPADLALIDTAAGLRLLTVHSNASQVSLIHPGTGAATTVTLSSRSTRIQAYTGADGKPHALLWNPGNFRFQRVDIEDLEKKKGKAIHDILASSPITGVTAMDAQFLLQHNGLTLSTYDAAADKLTAISNAGSLQDVQIAGTQLYLLTKSGSTTRISRIDLAKLSVESVETAFASNELLRWGDHGLALWNPAEAGALLAFPEGVLDLESARLVEGLGLMGGTEAP